MWLGLLVAACGTQERELGPVPPLWCGEELCDWTLEAGELRPVVSWHEGEPAVELVGDTRLARELDWPSGPPTCVRFDIMSRPHGTLHLSLGFGVGANWGTSVQGESWSAQIWTVPVPAGAHGARALVEKRGAAPATVAWLAVGPCP